MSVLVFDDDIPERAVMGLMMGFHGSLAVEFFATGGTIGHKMVLPYIKIGITTHL